MGQNNFRWLSLLSACIVAGTLTVGCGVADYEAAMQSRGSQIGSGANQQPQDADAAENGDN